jgi:hypothetical protein
MPDVVFQSSVARVRNKGFEKLNGDHSREFATRDYYISGLLLLLSANLIDNVNVRGTY